MSHNGPIISPLLLEILPYLLRCVYKNFTGDTIKKLLHSLPKGLFMQHYNVKITA